MGRTHSCMVYLLMYSRYHRDIAGLRTTRKRWWLMVVGAFVRLLAEDAAAGEVCGHVTQHGSSHADEVAVALFGEPQLLSFG